MLLWAMLTSNAFKSHPAILKGLPTPENVNLLTFSPLTRPFLPRMFILSYKGFVNTFVTLHIIL